MQRALSRYSPSASALLIFGCGLVWSERALAAEGTPHAADPAAPAGDPAPPADEAPPPAGEAAPPAETPPAPAEPAAPPPADFSAPPAGFSGSAAATVEAPPPPEQALVVQEETPPEPKGPFSKGSTRVSVLIGGGFAANEEYLILGVGGGFYVLNHLELGLDYEVWLFGDPTLQRLSPGVRYVLELGPLKPYIGAFYRHTFVSDFNDFDQVGARAGAYLIPRRGVFAGLGAVYEHLLDCDDEGVVECNQVYPELTVGFVF